MNLVLQAVFAVYVSAIRKNQPERGGNRNVNHNFNTTDRQKLFHVRFGYTCFGVLSPTQHTHSRSAPLHSLLVLGNPIYTHLLVVQDAPPQSVPGLGQNEQHEAIKRSLALNISSSLFFEPNRTPLLGVGLGAYKNHCLSLIGVIQG